MRALMSALACIALLGCTASEAPLPADISGTWGTSQVEASNTIHLTQNGTAISGTGTYFRNINPPTGTLTVTGSYIRPHVVLTLQFDDGTTAQFAGAAADVSHLTGSVAFNGGAADSMTFVRQ